MYQTGEVSAFYHSMQQIKLKGFSSSGGKNAQHCRDSTHVAEMLQKKLHGFFSRFTVPLNLTGITKRKRKHKKDFKQSRGALAREARQWSTMGKKM